MWQGWRAAGLSQLFPAQNLVEELALSKTEAMKCELQSTCMTDDIISHTIFGILTVLLTTASKLLMSAGDRRPAFRSRSSLAMSTLNVMWQWRQSHRWYVNYSSTHQSNTNKHHQQQTATQHRCMLTHSACCCCYYHLQFFFNCTIFLNFLPLKVNFWQSLEPRFTSWTLMAPNPQRQIINSASQQIHQTVDKIRKQKNSLLSY